MLKNKLIIKKIRNICILLMAIIIMVGVYTNVRRSRAENVIQIELEVSDKSEALGMQTILVDATETQDGNYLLDLPTVVNGNIVTKYYTSDGQEVLMNDENADKTLTLSESEVAEQKIQLQTDYDKKEFTTEDGQVVTLYNKELLDEKEIEQNVIAEETEGTSNDTQTNETMTDETTEEPELDDTVIVTGYMPLEAQVDIEEIDLSTLPEMTLPTDIQTIQKAYEVSVYQTLRRTIDANGNVIAEEIITPESASTEEISSENTNLENIVSENEINRTTENIASENTVEEEKIEYDPSIYNEQLVIKTKNTEANTITTIYGLQEDNQIIALENTTEDEYVNATFSKNSQTVRYIVATEQLNTSNELAQGPLSILYSATPYATSSDDGLIRQYEASNNTGNGFSSTTTTWKDLTGTQDATITGATWKSSSYLQLDGVDDWVNLGQVNFTNQVTLDIEVTLNSYDGKILMANYENGGAGLAQSDGIAYFQVYVSGVGYVTVASTSKISLGTKTRITGTYNGSKLCIYINGKLEATKTQSGTIQQPGENTVMAIGANPWRSYATADDGYSNINVYSAKVYNTAISLDSTAPTWNSSVSGGTYSSSAKTYALSLVGKDEKALNNSSSTLNSSKVTVKVGGTTVSSSNLTFGTASLSSDNKTKTFPLTIKNYTGGTIEITIKAGALVDEWGNTSATKTYTITPNVDVTAPKWDANIYEYTYNPSTQNLEITLRGTDETKLQESSYKTLSGSNVTVKVGSTTVSSSDLYFDRTGIETSSDGKARTYPIRIKGYTGASGGTITITIQSGVLEDAAGNTSVAKTYTFTPDVDSIAPTWADDVMGGTYYEANNKYSLALVGTDDTALSADATNLNTSKVTVKVNNETIPSNNIKITKLTTEQAKITYNLTINNYEPRNN